MNSKPKTVFRLNRLTAAVMSALLAGQSVAGPIGGQVVGGSGSISQTGATTTINQSTQNMAINWQSYNVNVDERVQYIQPNSSSISLNRILSNNGSTIAGRIDANGQVILVNPNGVFFTPTSVVNVGGIITSGLDIAPSDFMNGNYIFNEVLGTEGKVINSGTINASLGGNVALIGKQVENDGLIVANLGTVSLAAGKQAVLIFDNGGLLGVRVSEAILQDELGVDPAVMNSGEIHAEGGRVLLTASISQDVFSQAVNTAGLNQATSVVVNADGSFTLGGGADVVNSGTIDASTASSDQGAGRIVLLGENVTSSGELRADAASGNGGEIELHAQDKTLLTGNSITSARSDSHGKGGTVKVLGDKVGLFDVSMVDASGANGGGQVLIGGGYQGSNPAVRNASRTLVARDASIYVDALEYGDGGKIVSWSDESTWFYGSAFSRGGAVEGNGGLIEISGKGLSFNGLVDTSAANGSVGAVLFDPTNIVIIDSYDGSVGNDDGSLPDLSASPAVDFEISEGALESLGQTSSIILAATNNITVENLTDDALNLRSTTGSITFRADSDGVGGGAFVMNDTNDTIRTQGGSISITGADVTSGHLSTSWLGRTGGDVSITSTGGIDVASVDTHGGAVTGDTAGKAGGNVTLEAVTGIAVGSINASASNSSGDPDAKAGNAGSITITASGGTADVVLSGALTANGGNGPTSGDGNDGSGGDGGLISISAGQDVLVTSAAYISSNGGNGPTVDGRADGDGGDGGRVTLDAGRDIFVAATISSNGGNGPTSTDSNADGNGGDAGNITITAARNLSVSESISSLGGAAAAAGGWSAGADRAISFNGSDSDNTFNINDNITLAGSMVTVSGAGGSDHLVRGGNIANTWTINGENSGTLAFGNVSGTTTIAFNAIENLTGGAGQDQFTLAVGGNVAGLIDGGDDTDSLTIAAGGNRIIELGDRSNANTNVHRMETLTANAATRNELIGDNVANAWTLDGARNGTVADGTVTTAFTGIDDVTGGTATDSFTLNANFGGLIDGGDGTDSLTIAAGGNRIIELGDRSNANTNVHRMETLTANAATRNELIGDNVANTWTLDDARNGTVTYGTVTTAFTGIDDVTGGTATDGFTLNANFAGLIDGGDGTDSLTIAAGGNRIIELGDRFNANTNVHQMETLTANAATRNELIGDNVANTWTLDDARNGTVTYGTVTTAFTGIDDVTGGTATDGFTLNANFAGLIDGGDGTDSLTIAAGGNRIIELGDRFNANTNVHQMETLTANAATRNELIGDNVANTWTLDDARNGTVTYGTVTTAFTGIDDVTGGTATDGFTLNANFAGVIDGGDGTDSLTIAVDGDRVIELGDRFNANTNVHQMETLTANAATRNELIGDNVANTWTLDDARNGTVTYGTVTTAFTGIDDVTGGTATDGFTLNANFAGLIDGGDGTDSLTIAAGGNRIIELGDRFNANTNVHRMETLTANAATRNELVGDSDASVNAWTLTGPRNGMVFDGAMTTNFSNIDDATGTVKADSFALTGDFAGLIDGGNGSDSLTITAAGDRTIELGNRVNGNLNVHQVEMIMAYSSATNTLIGDSDSATNDWAINANRGGTVDNGSLITTFSYFDTISGGGSVDVFTVGVSGRVTNLNGGGGNDTFYISGTVNNMLDAGSGADAVHMYATGRVGAVQLGDGSDFFYMSGGAIDGDVDGGAGNDSFVINAGAIGGAIYGGADNDDISIGTAVASLHVNGGDGVDTLGTSRSGFELTLSDTALVVGFSATQIESISAVDGILNARNGTTNTWDIVGTNSGSVNTTSFNGFATLNGGDDADIFNVSGNGSVTGLISGQGGDDSLNIDLAGRTQAGGRINYDGGNQEDDSITITGIADGFSETYRTNQTVAGLPGSFDQLCYTSVGAGLDVNYRAVRRVEDSVVVANLLLENSNAANSILLGNNTFEIENSTSVGVNYSPGSKADITVTTPSGGTVQLVDNVSLPGTLTVTTGSLRNPDAHTINAGALVLQNAGAAHLLITNVGTLHVVNSGPIYIQEQDDLTLAGLDTTDLLDITAGGNIDSSAILISSAALNLVAGGNEDIYLDGQTHQLSGPLTLAAGNDIRLNNGGLTTLATVSAQNLTLDAGGNVIGDGPVTVGGTSTLRSTGDINLANAANDFDIIDINAAGKVTLHDANNVAGGSLTAGSIELTTVAGVGGSSAARLQTNTADLTINNTSGGVYVQNGRDLLVSITNLGDIDLSNNGTVIIDRLYANGTDYSTGQTYAGDVRVFTQNYPVFAKTGEGSHSHTSAPDIVGQNLYVETQASDLGSLGRYMSIRANDNFTFVGARGYVFYYGADPNRIVGTPDLVVFSGIMGLSGQQLIGVESLGDVDEAVFTDVRNYYHEDVAIMLPAHQRMTDDDDEEEQRRREAVN